jgi:hypothetical protein
MNKHEALTHLGYEDLDWLARFADRLRQSAPQFAQDDAGGEADDVARSMFEQAEWRDLTPEAAADRWLADPARLAAVRWRPPHGDHLPR